jgi:hypothetical protein
VLIDDARSFGEGDYHSLEAIRAQVTPARPGSTMEVRDDIIPIDGRTETTSSPATR